MVLAGGSTKCSRGVRCRCHRRRHRFCFCSCCCGGGGGRGGGRGPGRGGGVCTHLNNLQAPMGLTQLEMIVWTTLLTMLLDEDEYVLGHSSGLLKILQK